MKTTIIIILLALFPFNIKAEILSAKCRDVLIQHYAAAALQPIDTNHPNRPTKNIFPVEIISKHCTTASDQNQVGVIIMGGGNYTHNIIFSKTEMHVAEYWFKKAIENGSINAIYNLAKLYQEMRRGKTTQIIINLYQTAADLGHQPSRYELGKQLIQLKDYRKAYPVLTELAKQGHAGANYQIGRMMAKGLYLQESPRKSLKYFKYAAQKGNIKALQYLVIIYRHGTGGVYVDPKQSKKWSNLLSKSINPDLYKNMYKLHIKEQLDRILAEKNLEYLY